MEINDTSASASESFCVNREIMCNSTDSAKCEPYVPSSNAKNAKGVSSSLERESNHSITGSNVSPQGRLTIHLKENRTTGSHVEVRNSPSICSKVTPRGEHPISLKDYAHYTPNNTQNKRTNPALKSKIVVNSEKPFIDLTDEVENNIARAAFVDEAEEYQKSSRGKKDPTVSAKSRNKSDLKSKSTCLTNSLSMVQSAGCAKTAKRPLRMAIPKLRLIRAESDWKNDNKRPTSLNIQKSWKSTDVANASSHTITTCGCPGKPSVASTSTTSNNRLLELSNLLSSSCKDASSPQRKDIFQNSKKNHTKTTKHADNMKVTESPSCKSNVNVTPNLSAGKKGSLLISGANCYLVQCANDSNFSVPNRESEHATNYTAKEKKSYFPSKTNSNKQVESFSCNLSTSIATSTNVRNVIISGSTIMKEGVLPNISSESRQVPSLASTGVNMNTGYAVRELMTASKEYGKRHPVIPKIKLIVQKTNESQENILCGQELLLSASPNTDNTDGSRVLSKSDLLNQQIIQSLSSILKTNQSKPSNLPTPQTANGQINNLPVDINSNKTNQPVILIQGTTPVATNKATQDLNSNLTTGTQSIPGRVPANGPRKFPIVPLTNNNQLVQLIPVTLVNTNPLMTYSPTSFQNVMIMNVGAMNKGETSKVMSVTSTCVTPLVIAINDHTSPASTQKANVNAPKSANSKNQISLGKVIVSSPALSDVACVYNSYVVTHSPSIFASTMKSPLSSVMSVSKSLPLKSGIDNSKEHSESKMSCKKDLCSSPYDHNCLLSQSNTAVTINSNYKVTSKPDKVPIDKKNIKQLSVDSNWIESSCMTVLNKKSTPKGGKVLLPINDSGCSRTNGIKPYKRTNAVLYDTYSGVISTINNNNQYPVISEYKSLAVGNLSKETLAQRNLLKSNLWQIVQKPVQALPRTTTTTNNYDLTRNHISNPADHCKNVAVEDAMSSHNINRLKLRAITSLPEGSCVKPISRVSPGDDCVVKSVEIVSPRFDSHLKLAEGLISLNSNQAKPAKREPCSLNSNRMNSQEDVTCFPSGVRVKTEVVDLTEETHECSDDNMTLKSSAGSLIDERFNGAGNVSGIVKDTIGMIRSDHIIKVTNCRNKSVPSIMKDTIGIVRSDRDHLLVAQKENIVAKKDSADLRKNSMSTIIQKSPCDQRITDSPVKYPSDRLSKVTETTVNNHNDDSSNNINNHIDTTGKSSSFVQTIPQSKNPEMNNKPDNRYRSGPNFPSCNYTEAPTTFDKISRTFFALDRLYRNRKLRGGYEATRVIIESLRDLRDELIVERSKQRRFMDKNLVHWKEHLKTRVNIEGKELSTKSPAQRLLEKFSLNSLTDSQEKVVDEPKKDPPIEVRKSVNKACKDRPKTFMEILEDQRKRKNAKKNVKIPEISLPVKEISKETLKNPFRLSDVLIEKNNEKDVKMKLPDTPLASIVAVFTNSSNSSKVDVITSTTPFSSGNEIIKNNLKRPSPDMSTSVSSISPIENKKIYIKPPQVPLSSALPVSVIPTVPSTVIQVTIVASSNTTCISTSASIVTKPKVAKPKSTVDKTGKTIATPNSLQSLESELAYRTRHLRRYSNPKDPLNSVEDRALQRALALSLKETNRGKMKRKDDISNDKKQACDEGKKRVSKEEADMSPLTESMHKKRRTTELDKLVDIHWNESWIKQDAKRSARNERSIREERALHYAMSRFAEMEYEEQVGTSKTSSPTSKTSSPTAETKCKDTSTKSEKDEDVSAGKRKAKNSQQKRPLKTRTTSKKKDCPESKKKISKNVYKVQKAKLTSSKQKKNELVKKAMRHFAQGKNKTNSSPSLIVDKLPIKYSTQRNTEMQVILTKKEYLLVPKYRGFKDFTPIVVSSRTRGQATSEDRDKLKKEEFPLMVIEKVGNETKNVIVNKGEDKIQKLNQAFQNKKSQLDSMSNSKKWVYVNTYTGETILHKASRSGYADLAESNIKSGANIHARDNAGWTALHEACAYGKVEVAKVLLKYGADPNCVSNTGIRPLHDAVEKMDIDMIRTLLSYGADPSIASYKGFLPIDCTKNERVRKLLKGYDIDCQTTQVKPGIENRWEFAGSCDLLDAGHSDIFMDIPEEKPPVFEFEMSSRPMINSYYLPHTNDEKLIIGYRNYFILSEVLERLNTSRNVFLKKHNVSTLTLSWNDLSQHVGYDVLIHRQDLTSLSTSNEVELVFIGASALKKLLNSKTVRLDYS